MMAILLQSGFIGILLTVCACLQWSTSPKDGDLFYICNKSDVIIPWAYNTTTGESIASIEWFYDGFSSEMIAVYTHNNFVPLPTFSKRVNFVDNAGIKLAAMTKGNSGNYTVEMNGFGNGSALQARRTVVVEVVDDLRTKDGYIHVTQSHVASLDNATDELKIELKCGELTYLGELPPQVEWITPSDAVYTSSNYEGGYFRFLLPNPVATGNYTCRITKYCISGSDKSILESTLFVDGMDARVTLMETRQTTLQKENHDLTAANTQLRQRLERIEERESSQVVFYAHGFNSGNLAFSANTPMVFSQVRVNEANAYSNFTGIFTVPFNGFYFFAGASGPGSSGLIAFYLSVDGQRMGSFAVTTDPGGGESVSVQLVAHLRKNQRVYLASYHEGRPYMSRYSYFSGFLIAHD